MKCLVMTKQIKIHKVKLPCSDGKSASETVCSGGVSRSRLRCFYSIILLLINYARIFKLKLIFMLLSGTCCYVTVLGLNFIKVYRKAMIRN